MNNLHNSKQIEILKLLLQGYSLQTIGMKTNVATNTVKKLLMDVGKSCAVYQDKVLTQLPCEKIQVKEVLAFSRHKPMVLNIWLRIALCSKTKIVICWLMGKKDTQVSQQFIANLSNRLSNKAQLITEDSDVCLTATNNEQSLAVTDSNIKSEFEADLILLTRVSQKITQIENTIALHFMYYNFSSSHRNLQATPAMKLKISDHIWSVDELLQLAVKP